MSGPTFSIVIPTYNCAPLLAEALASVRAQTREDWEAIVVDNHSADDTVARVQGLGDARIRLLSIHNKGVIAASRNLGISNAKAPYVAFLDADDLWRPEKLARCHDLLRQGFDVVGHGERHFDGQGYEKDVFYGTAERANFEDLLLRGNVFSTSALVCKRELVDRLGGFTQDPKLVTAEDYDLWLKLMHAGAKATIIQEILGDYRIHANSASASAARHMAAVRRVVERHFHEGIRRPSLGQRARYAMRWSRVVAAGARLLARQGSYADAARFALGALTDQ